MSDRRNAVRGRVPEPERRRVLKLIGLLPLAGGLAAWASACGGGGEEEAAPPATSPEPAPAPAPQPEPSPPMEEAPGAAATAPQPDPATALVTELDSMKANVQALQYVNQSPKPDQNCANCRFYTAKQGGRGSCQLFTQGLVEAEGWCTGWQAKDAAAG
jgi:hypothetical protein